MKRIISFVGSSGCGKTTLIVKLIEYFNKLGMKVGTIKHTHHRFETDKEGKDSYRHFHAGAQASMIISEDKIGFVRRIDKIDISKLADAYFRDLDLLIVEGFKNDDTPKIEVYRGETGRGLLFENLKNVIAVASDMRIKGIKHLNIDNIPAIARFILKYMKIEK